MNPDEQHSGSIERRCGGKHTITCPLQKGVKFTPVNLSNVQMSCPEKEETFLRGIDGGIYRGMVTPDPSALEEATNNWTEHLNISNVPRIARETLNTTVVKIPENPLRLQKQGLAKDPTEDIYNIPTENVTELTKMLFSVNVMEEQPAQNITTEASDSPPNQQDQKDQTPDSPSNQQDQTPDSPSNQQDQTSDSPSNQQDQDPTSECPHISQNLEAELTDLSTNQLDQTSEFFEASHSTDTEAIPQDLSTNQQDRNSEFLQAPQNAEGETSASDSSPNMQDHISEPSQISENTEIETPISDSPPDQQD